MERKKRVWIITQCVHLVLKIINVILYYCCYRIEKSAYEKVRAQAGGICIQFQEIAEAVSDFLLYAQIPIYPDYVFAIAGLPCCKLYNHSIGILYNFGVAYYAFSVPNTLLNALTHCGRPMQEEIADAVSPLYGACAMHIFIGLFTILLYDKWDIYFWFKLRPKFARALYKKWKNKEEPMQTPPRPRRK